MRWDHVNISHYCFLKFFLYFAKQQFTFNVMVWVIIWNNLKKNLSWKKEKLIKNPSRFKLFSKIMRIWRKRLNLNPQCDAFLVPEAFNPWIKGYFSITIPFTLTLVIKRKLLIPQSSIEQEKSIKISWRLFFLFSFLPQIKN